MLWNINWVCNVAEVPESGQAELPGNLEVDDDDDSTTLTQVHTGFSCNRMCTQVFIVLTGAHMCFLYSQVHTGVSCTHRCTQVFLVDTGAHRCLYCALRIHSADYAVERCLSVCLSICTPYTPVFRGHR